MTEPPTTPTTPTSATNARNKRRRLGVSLATLVAVVTLATGVLTLKDQLFPPDDGAKAPTVVVTPQTHRTDEIQRFDGIAGHLAESRALLDFLDQHDDDIVYLEVGFPTLSPPGPISGDNVVVETVSASGGTTTTEIKEIALMTRCPPDLPSTTENPTPRDACTGTSLDIQGEETTDSGTHFQHGVPVIKGYFKVDVTGGLQMGLSPIFLRPLTFEQATQQ